MKKIIMLVLLACMILTACQSQEPLVYNVNKSDNLKEYESELAAESEFEESLEQKESQAQAESEAAEIPGVWTKKTVQKEKTRVHGIYITANTAGMDTMDTIISHIDGSEINAVVIDIKDDNGNITYKMNTPLVQEVGSGVRLIPDLPALLKKLHEHGIYVIARCVCFRDPYLAEAKPEWAMQLEDGSVFRDQSGMAWINPYKREVWEYIKEVADKCADEGFDEVQLDYVRFCTERGTNKVVYDENDTQGMQKPQIITEFVKYMSDAMAKKNIFMSTDVFGTIIGSYADTVSVGQDYPELAAAADYISPMIYPSHYNDGNFGIEHPDSEPYKTIYGALESSQKDLGLEKVEGVHQASVRPWLQGFTASYMKHYINYGADEIRQQIQAVYDSGYDEWLIWNASNSYNWKAFKTKEEADSEYQEIVAKRKAAEEAASIAAAESERAAAESESASIAESENAAKSADANADKAANSADNSDSTGSAATESAEASSEANS